jgi:DNA-binding transcriptional LysR family regulator
MNLRFVEAFHWAAMLKSVTRAAEKLHITQSALSSRIAALESELGALLLDRRDKRFRLTVAGQRFQWHAQKMLDLQRQVKQELGSGLLRARVLRLGVIESVVHSWLTAWLDEMRSAHADFELELTVETTPVLIDQLQRGKLDLAFAAQPASGEGVRNMALAPMPMCFAIQAGGGRGSPRACTLAELAERDLLTFQRGSQPHLALLQLLRRHGLAARRVHAISSISAMTQLVEIGFGVATLPQDVVARLSQRKTLRELVCDAVPEPLPIHASYREDPSQPLIEAGLASAPGVSAQKSSKPKSRSSSKKSMST